MEFTLTPNHSVSGPEGITITHEGYGHKIGLDETSGYSFLEMTIKQKNLTETFRIETPVKPGTTHEWNNWIITILKCEDQGPPHSDKAKTIFKVSKK